MADPIKLPEGFDWRAFTPEDSPKTPMDVMGDPLHTRLATAEVVAGGQAYDFTSPIYDFSTGIEVDTGEQFHLQAAVRDKPVALIFGSYT